MISTFRMIKSNYQLIFILFLCKYVFCDVNKNFAYCVSEYDNYGMAFVNLKEGKDSPVVYEKSKFLSNKSVLFNLAADSVENWEHYNSIKNFSILRKPVFDQRWENFPDNHDDLKEFLNGNQSAFFSVWLIDNNGTNDLKLQKWNHLLLENGSLSLYNSSHDNTFITNKTMDFYNHHQQSLWKKHEYSYLYTNKANNQLNYSIPNESCSSFQDGCIILFMIACTGCKIELEINSVRTPEFQGNGSWTTIKLSLRNTTNCPTLSIRTDNNNLKDGERLFWAVGDIGYLLINQSCKNTQRYLKFDPGDHPDVNLPYLKCTDSWNKKFNFTYELPIMKLPEKIIKNRSDIDDQGPDLSAFNPLYLLLIIPAVLLGVIAFVALWCKRKNKTISTVRYNTSSPEEHITLIEASSPPPISDWKPIKTSEYLRYVQDMFDPNNRKNYLQKQFESLPSGNLKSVHEGQKPENLRRNRFAKIYPYDDNRVILKKSIDGTDPGSDYINASYIKGFNNTKEYIATQNPLEETVVDFYRMIWQENVEYIVMISSNSEEYYRYWPKYKKKVEFDGIHVSNRETISYEFYDHRVLTIRRYGDTREINQLHFHAWSTEMLSSYVFMDFMNHLLKIPHNSAPVVFHCLAGVGRSACIVLCDIALRTSAITGSINLYEITKQLRECRPNMVQNSKQYQLAHLIIYELMNYKNSTTTNVNSDFNAHFSRLIEGNETKKNWATHLENIEWLYEAITPHIRCNKYPKRNRYLDTNLPMEHSRVVLEYKVPDYIHAMYVNDYKQKKQFIVAQQPLANTVSNFWLMILQNKVQTVISLNELDFINKGDVLFFPNLNKPYIKIESNIIIQFCSEESHFYYDKISIEVYNGEKHLVTVCLLNVKGWPKIRAVPDSTDVLISIWELVKEQKTEAFPMVVCCDDGVRSSSLVVCFFYMVEKMLQQHQCDIVGAVKAVRRSHVQFINFEQFVFLHHCALAFYKNCFKKYDE